MNAMRQPANCAASASGAPAARMPSWLVPNTHDNPVLQRAGGIHADTSTNADMKLAAQPKPVTTRAATSVGPSVANACSAAPAVISTDSAATVLRGPMRSNATPTATCATSNAPKNPPFASPSIRGESVRSAISSGAITASAARKNCDRIVVAASRAMSTAMSREWTTGSEVAARVAVISERGDCDIADEEPRRDKGPLWHAVRPLRHPSRA